jgi:dolichyl-diphosphooligosaccharide--protein glycosyltransferase
MTDNNQINNQNEPNNQEIKFSFLELFQKIGRKAAPSITMATLGLISLLAFLIRIFSVIRYESVIHEFDPWFNYRVTQFLTNEGAYAFWNWYDPESWYPLGRIIGGTTYPGLMFTSAFLHWLCNTLLFPVDIRNVCVFLAPVFAALTAVSAYYFAKEVTGRSDSGLLCALFIAIVPGYISRSVAGSYDNEGVAIFALVTTFYFFIKAVNTGSIFWSTLCALLYFYMVAAWGGYVFIINLIPLYTLFLIIVGRTDVKIYISYSVFYILGTILSMQVPFVMFQAIKSSEHMLSHGVFLILQVYMFVQFIKTNLSEQMYQKLFKISLMGTAALFVMAFLYLLYKGNIYFSARSLTLLDPTYAKKFIPIVASVSEHQPTTWSSFFFDLHYLLLWAPLGLYYCYLKPTNSRLFVAIFGVSSVYFSCVMVRLLLLSSPALCLLSGIGVSELIHFFVKQAKNYSESEEEDEESQTQSQQQQQPQARRQVTGTQQQNTVQSEVKNTKKYRYSIEIIIIFLFVLITMLVSYIFHCTWVGAEAYASPSIILANKDRYGNKHIIDDFREAYYWLRMNTKPDAKIVSWWDYGYQIAGMSNRAVIVDNNTWNATHIALVGSTLTNDEEESFKLCKMIDADYVLIIFGGFSAYSGDDINKFIWIIRITAGYYPRVKEENYLSKGVYRTDSGASETMLNSMMYKFSYYRFDEVKASKSSPEGYDMVRGYVMGRKNIKLRHFTEAYTTDNWIVRIFAVNDYPNREIGVKSRFKIRLMYTSNVNYNRINKPQRDLA